MAQFDSIAFGENKWNDKVNKNFSKINVYSGNIYFLMLAPATGNLGFKFYNGVVYFFGAVQPNSTGDVTVATVPDVFSSVLNLSVPDKSGGQAINASINGEHQLILRKVPNDNANYAFDGNSVFVGDIDLTNLGGN